MGGRDRILRASEREGKAEPLFLCCIAKPMRALSEGCCADEWKPKKCGSLNETTRKGPEADLLTDK